MKQFATALLAIVLGTSCAQHPAEEKKEAIEKDSTVSIKMEAVKYQAGNTTATGYVAYDDAKKDKRPIVLIVPEWWGLNDYVKKRAEQLASLGYLAFAVDIFGEGKTAADPQQAMALTGPFYKDPQLGKARLEAALAKAKTFEQADTTKTAAIGYCFGGSMVLNAAKLGTPFNGVVSFHGGLANGAAPLKDGVKAQLLVLNGAADQMVKPTDIATFKKQLDDAGVKYEFVNYEGATHAFTNPASTENGKKFNMPIAYNAAADTASFKAMQEFFRKIF
jgi:dienelactone hydrolase